MKKEEYIDKIINKLREKGVKEERLRIERIRMEKEYDDIFELVDIYNGVGYYCMDEETYEMDDYTEDDLKINNIEAYKWVYSFLNKIGIKVFNEDDGDRYGYTELHEAVVLGDIEEIKNLIESGFDTSLKDNSGHTAYMLALMEDKADIIKIFEDYGIEK